jgi:hypothetical protein
MKISQTQSTFEKLFNFYSFLVMSTQTDLQHYVLRQCYLCKSEQNLVTKERPMIISQQIGEKKIFVTKILGYSVCRDCGYTVETRNGFDIRIKRYKILARMRDIIPH